MKRTPTALFAAAALLATTAPVAFAHPGHGDGHELTWDLDHLAAHPVATVMCLTVLAAGVWLLTKAVASDRAQRVRK